jgi:hypothetical protein
MAKDILMVDSYKIALWDVTQMFRNALKYENVIHEGYLTGEEDEVVEKLQKAFFDILDDNGITEAIENQ